MNYERIYHELVNRGKNRTLCEGEWHHILPRSMGGCDARHNLVHLTYREHFIAHVLLYKIHKNRQMAFALGRMINGSDGLRCSSKTYEIARNAHKKAVSDWSSKFMKGKTVFRNKLTGATQLHVAADVDYSVWEGISTGNKFEGEKGVTVYKDASGKTYRLAVTSPLIAELGLKGVGNWANATKRAAELEKAKPWYNKSSTNPDAVILLPSLFEWYNTHYDSRRPKATGIARWKSANGITLFSKLFTVALNNFKSGYVLDESFYEVYNEIIENRKI